MSNTIGSASDSIGAVGIYNQQVAGSVIANNSIQNVKDAVPAGGNIAGIWIATKQLNLRVYNNVINGVRNRTGATGAVFAAGIYHFGTAGDSSRSKFYNNMVYGLDNPSTSVTATVWGIYPSTAIQDAAAFNSVYVTGADAAGIVSGALYVSSASVGLTLKDIILINTRTTTGTGRAIALYLTAAPTSLATNYNDLFVPTQTGRNVAAVGTTNYPTLTSWQATGRDPQSVNVIATFTAPDLHIDSTVYTPLNGGARPIPGVVTDIDGQTRNATTPDIGADEFNAPPPPTPGWTAQNSGITNQFYSVKAVSQSVAWAAAVGGRVLRTVNGGSTWTSVGNGHIGAADIHNIEAVSGNTAFVTTTPGTTYIFRTTNGGTSWDTVYSLGGTGAFIDTIKMQDPNNGIALGDPVGGKWTIVRTSNGGASWSSVTVGTAGYNIAVAGSGTDDFWMARGTDVYRSTNRGATGTQSYTGTGTFYDVDFYTAGGNTYGWGVKDSGNIVMAYFTITGVSEETAEVPQTFSMMQNYPNPFNPTTTLRYALPKDARVVLKIYNILGQQVATLRDEVENVGYHDVVWNGRDDFGAPVASGVYFYRIEARPTDGSEVFSSIKKMLMLK